jgi:ribosomal protein S18 acetylase RimI-like enzyme
MISFNIRPATSSDEPFLREMLFHSLYVEPGREPFTRDVLRLPEVARYVAGWGRAGDLGFLAIEDATGEPIGAVWSRLSVGDDKGFAYLDDATPELAVALLPEHRGRGVGTLLLTRYLERARTLFPAVSLSVSPDNPAMRLYERLGFKAVDVRGGHPVMKKDLSPVR